MKKEYLFLLVIFLMGFAVRFISVWPANTIIGFDQARDLFDAEKIINGHLRIIGPTAGNNPHLHHGIAWIYFLVPPLLISNNPIYAVLWNCLFNTLAAVIIYFNAIALFKSKKVGYIAAIIASVSYYYVQFSGWLSNPTATLFSLPLFLFGLIKYYRGKKWGLPLSLFFLGLTIQFELFFLYLIPTSVILWLILKPRIPSLKLILLSLFTFMAATSTMIATEIKYNFAGVKSIFSAGQLVGNSHTGFFDHLLVFLTEKWEAFYLNFWPQNEDFGTIIGIFAVVFLIYEIVKRKKEIEIVKTNLFLLTLFFSPAIMFILGAHNAPWFYIGRPSSAILIGAYILSKIKSKTLITSILLLIIFANLTAIQDSYGKGQPFLEPDKASILSTQISTMKYTYEKSAGEKFAIDTVTNPLYVNVVWAWNYNWYYKEYGYKPTWLGGDQIPPYDTLQNSVGTEKYFFLIVDKTDRIPPVYKDNAVNNLKKKAILIEEKEFDGIKVSMWKNLNQASNGQIPKK